VPAPRPRKISEFKPTLTKLAQTSHYEVIISGLKTGLQNYLSSRGVFSRSLSDIGLLCHSATLPGSSFATADVYGDYMGVTESLPHTRTFIPLDLSFYVDREYKTMKLFEHWMEYMHDASDASRLSPKPHFRMKYPEEYKVDTVKIVKFERDYNRYIEYNFYGLYPKTMNATAISYDKSELLKIGVTLNYDYYVSGKVDSKSRTSGDANNIAPFDNLSTFMSSNPYSFSKTGTDPSSITAAYTATGQLDFLNSDAYKQFSNFKINDSSFSSSLTQGSIGFSLGKRIL
jgi:hypothetical protein